MKEITINLDSIIPENFTPEKIYSNIDEKFIESLKSIDNDN